MRKLLLYAAMLAFAVLAFAAIDRYGSTQLAAPPLRADAAQAKAAAAPAGDVFFHVLLAMAAMIAAGRLLGLACRRIGQPQVIGEVIAGIALGPSLLGRLWPAGEAFLLPADAAPHLRTIAQLGVVLYMFLIGLELNTGLLRKRGDAAVAISHASIVVPFTLGAAFALVAYPRLATADVSFTVFALFFGAALSITAFPVLARILAERGLAKTELGATAIACAAIDDATAWCLLALIVGVAQAKLGGAILTVLLTLGYVAFMFTAVRPIMGRLVRLYDEREQLAQPVAAAVFLLLLLSALATELIGIHALFGAFLLGAVIPHESRIARDLLMKLEDLVGVLFLPAFFAYTGMRTELQLVSGADNVFLCLAIIAVATLGKFGGAMAAGRLCGMGWRDAAAVGALMNTRGLMGLIVLNVGLELGVISPTLFAMMALMALATTMATGPLLSWLKPNSSAGA